MGDGVLQMLRSSLPVRAVGERALIVAVAICLMFLTPPNIVSAYGDSFVRAVFRYGQYASIIAAAAAFVLRGKLSAFSIVAIVYACCGILTALVGGATFSSGVRATLPFVAAALLACAMMPRRRKELLWGVLLIYGAYSAVNLVVILVVPAGVPPLHLSEAMTLFGNRNGFNRFYVAAIFASFLLDESQGRYVSARSVIIYAVAAAQSLLAPSMTALVALLLVTGGYFFIIGRRPRRVFTAFTYAGFYLAAFFAFVVMRLQGVFGFVIESVMDKRLDFTGRTPIWDAAFDAMDPSHLLLGYYRGGISPLGLLEGAQCWSAHNAVLDLLVWGGLAGLLLGCGLIGLACLRLWKARNERRSALYSLYLGACFICGLMEAIMFPQFGLFLGMAYSDSFSDERSPEAERPRESLRESFARTRLANRNNRER